MHADDGYSRLGNFDDGSFVRNMVLIYSPDGTIVATMHSVTEKKTVLVA